MIRRLDLPDNIGVQPDGRVFAPSALRNLAPIQSALAAHLPPKGRVLELASGFGDHILAHAKRFPDLTWQPSEAASERFAVLGDRVARSGQRNLELPLALNACVPGWGQEQAPRVAIVLVNLLHLISDGEVAVLFDEVHQALGQGGVFAVYGPFLRDGETTSAGDAAFHADLQAQDPEIGYKDLSAMCSVLEALQMRVRVEAMPANNAMIIATKL